MTRTVHVLLILVLVLSATGCSNELLEKHDSGAAQNVNKEIQNNVYRGSPVLDNKSSGEDVVVDSKTNPSTDEMDDVYKDIDKEIQDLMTDLDSLESSGDDKQLERIEKEGQL